MLGLRVSFAQHLMQIKEKKKYVVFNYIPISRIPSMTSAATVITIKIIKNNVDKLIKVSDGVPLIPSLSAAVPTDWANGPTSEVPTRTIMNIIINRPINENPSGISITSI